MAEAPTRLKSPPYPSLSLENAIQRAEQLREVAKGFSVPLPSAAKAWGYSPTSSSVVSVAGALNQFGLLDEAGSADARRIKVSQLGDTILMDKRPNSSERTAALKRAALTPKVFQELWEKFQTSDVDEHTLVYELTLGRTSSGRAPYSETAAVDVARKYAESLAFAGLQKVEENGEEQDLGDADAIGAAQKEPEIQSAQAVRGGASTSTTVPPFHPDAASFFEERKALEEGGATLIWPRNLSEDSAEDMEYWLNGVLRQIKRRAARAAAKSDE